MVEGSVFVRSYLFIRSCFFLENHGVLRGALYFSHFIISIRINNSISITVTNNLTPPNQCTLTFMIHIALILLLIPLSRLSSKAWVGQRYNYILTPPNAEPIYALPTPLTEHTKAENSRHWEWWALIHKVSKVPNRSANAKFLGISTSSVSAEYSSCGTSVSTPPRLFICLYSYKNQRMSYETVRLRIDRVGECLGEKGWIYYD